MQEFSLAFGRVTRSVVAANPELKNHVNDLLNRAYYNLHATPITAADPQWVSAISGAALQLSLDLRAQSLTVRETIKLFEDVIRISEEHQQEARRNAAMALNVFYLKETALDGLDASAFLTADTKVVGLHKAHTGRVDVPKPSEAFAS